jgi:hypothetical protein
MKIENEVEAQEDLEKAMRRTAALHTLQPTATGAGLLGGSIWNEHRIREISNGYIFTSKYNDEIYAKTPRALGKAIQNYLEHRLKYTGERMDNL